MRIELAKKFLSYFGKPLVKFYKPERDVIDVPKDLQSRWRTLEELFTENAKRPYPIHFTPNGNYGEKNGKGIPIKFSYKNSDDPREGTPPLWNAFFIDIDFHAGVEGYQNIDDWLNKYIDLFNTSFFKPTFIARTPKGLHLYFIFDPDYRFELSASFNDSEIEHIIKFILSYFEGADQSKGRKLNHAIRLPFTYYWKKDPPVVVDLYQCLSYTGKLALKKIEKIEDYDDEHIIYVLKHYWKRIYELYNNHKKTLKTEETLSSKINSSIVKDINLISFPSLFEKLKKYPKEYNGKKYTFFIKGNYCGIEYEDGKIDITDGYKRNKTKNYLNCFSSDIHPIEERPRGPVLPFLYYYFNQKIGAVRDFLRAEFDIDIMDGTTNIENVYWKINGNDYFIYCDRNGITLTKEVVSKGASSLVHKQLFRVPFRIIGKTETYRKPGMGESESKNLMFVLQFYTSEEKVVFATYSTKNERNRNMASRGIFFYGDDNDLGLFYQAIWHSDEIKDFDLVYLSGYYKDYVVIGPYSWIPSGGDLPENVIILPSISFQKVTHTTQISTQEFLNKLYTIFDPIIAFPSFAMSLITMGMNIRSELSNVISIYPGLFLTGETKSGKTTMSEIIKVALGFDKKARQVAANAISSQPFKVDASDYCPLWMEEFTGDNISLKIQGDMRNVINREVSKRGMMNNNIIFNLRSPLIVMGERVPDFESLINRFVTITFDKKYHRGTKFDIISIQNYGIQDDVLRIWHYWYVNKLEELGNLYLEYVKWLITQGLESRNADAWAYVCVANSVFELGMNEKDLLSIIMENLKVTGEIGNTSGDDDPFIKLENEFQQALLERKVIVTKIIGKLGYTIKIMWDNNYFIKNKIKIHKIKNDCNDMLTNWIYKDYDNRKKYLDFYSPYIDLQRNVMTFTIPNTECSPLQERLAAFHDNYLVLVGANAYSAINSETPYGVSSTGKSFSTNRE